ncbi:MAG: ArsR family transcriptional regulator [Anaerolineae bacterium]|nr:ArsR family transcriptional regulator [Anaerolineae bacterium]
MQVTRERILNILKEHGQATVDALSEELGLTAVTVRHHLDILRGEGLVAAPSIHRRKTPGRPQYVYTLADEADSFFPKRYRHLSNLILDEIRAYLSPAEVEQMMQDIGKRIASQANVPTKNGFENRLIAATKFLNELGYMARWEQHDNGDYLLHIANCPYEEVSKQDQQVCMIDMTLLTHLLGVSPERISWSAQGDQDCSYLFHTADK